MKSITHQRDFFGPVPSYSLFVSRVLIKELRVMLMRTDLLVCAVSARYYRAKPALYPVAMEFARDLAGLQLVEGSRSVDVCQAYLIMAVYPVPKKKWAEDKSWLLMGVAIR